MSQNSLLPNSSINSRLITPSCHELYGTDFEENQPAANILDRIQRQLEEEIRYSDRLIIAADDLIAESKGSISKNYCRCPSRTEEREVCYPLLSRPETAPGKSFTPFPLSVSFCDEETPRPQLPSTPYPNLRYESRDAFSETSQRATRLPPLEYTTIKSRIPSPSPRTNQHLHSSLGESGITKRKVPGNSNYSNTGVDFSQSRDPSDKGRPFDGTREKDLSFEGTKERDRPFDGTREKDLSFEGTKERDRPFDGTEEKDRAFEGTREKDRASEGTRERDRAFEGTKEKDRLFHETKNSGRTFHETRDGTIEETRYPSFVNHTQSFFRESKATPSNTGRGPSAHSFSRGSSANPSDFASKSIKEIVAPGLCSLSTFCGRTSTFSDCGEYTKLNKIGANPHFHYGRHYHESPQGFVDRKEKATAALCHLSQLRKTPSYYRCGVNQGTEFLNVCCPKVKDITRVGGKVVSLPKTPCLPQEDVEDLIKCETKDVESAWYLTLDEKKTYKKPCPKQQKAQLIIKSLVQAHANQICGTPIYSTLEHPDPEDISPEVAAAMMFSQEQGIRMEECPNATITRLFPDEPKPQFPEKLPQGSISVVDPSQNDQEEMIEKSAAVPSEGVSDSAYTRTMREKGEDMGGAQKSYDVDFAIRQLKREYVLVAQKPQRVNKVQFRAGNLLSWFPGYFSAFPDDGGLKLVSSPSGLFHKAWIHSNPGNIPVNDVIVLE